MDPGSNARAHLELAPCARETSSFWPSRRVRCPIGRLLAISRPERWRVSGLDPDALASQGEIQRGEARLGRAAKELARELGGAAKPSGAGGGDIAIAWLPDPEAEDALVLPTNMTIDPKGRLVVLDAGANLIRFLPAGQF